MGPFYVEWVESRVVISAVKYALYIKLSHRSVNCSIFIMGLFYVEWVEHGANP